jgi:hypothetical protein
VAPVDPPEADEDDEDADARTEASLEREPSVTSPRASEWNREAADD